MVAIKEWYTRVNDVMPKELPPLTAEEAIRAAKKLIRFGGGQYSGEVQVTSGRRSNWVRNGVLVVNPDRGWNNLIHDMSHWCHSGKPHNRDHARLELRMRKEALKRGWLDGALKPAPKPEKQKPDEKQIRYQRTLAAIERWEKKLKRAQTALKKLGRRQRYYERRVL